MIAAMQQLTALRPGMLLVAGMQAENREAWHLGSQGQLQRSDRRAPPRSVPCVLPSSMPALTLRRRRQFASCMLSRPMHGCRAASSEQHGCSRGAQVSGLLLPSHAMFAPDATAALSRCAAALPSRKQSPGARRCGIPQEQPYWGFWQLRKGNGAAGLVDAASAVLLLGGPKDHSLPLLHAYPGLVGKIYHVRAAAVPSWEGPQLPPPTPWPSLHIFFV